VLHIFQGHTAGDASDPLGGLVIDTNGNLYGATGGGGTGNCEILGTFPGCGAVYELSPPTEKGGPWTETVLYSFQGGTDGYVPYGDLVSDQTGNLYGVTLYGGGYGTNCGDGFYPFCGTVFELSPPRVKGSTWTERVLHSFSGSPGTTARNEDGANPNGGLLIDKTGTIYGTTQIGGGGDCPRQGYNGCGVAYKLSPPAKRGGAWTEAILHSFTPLIDGALPQAGLVADAKSNLYGTTFADGAVFMLSPPEHRGGPWTETTLHRFTNVGGNSPEGSLLFSINGSLCGTTEGSSGAPSLGTVYCMSPTGATPGNWTFDSLYTFQGPPDDGANPIAGLTAGKGGILYGTTQLGGTASACSFTGCGTVFSVSPR
jgi:hypothetical protein